MRLHDKVAIITGAGRGIGRATALRFAEEGARVVCADLDLAFVTEVADEINARACRRQWPGRHAAEGTSAEGNGVKPVLTPTAYALPVRVNVADAASCRAMVAAALERYGRVDIMVNNAGIVRDARIVKMTEDEFDSVIDVNLKGVYNCTRAVAEHMSERGTGVILSTASIVATYGNFGQTNYVAAKAGVVGMTKVWARELGRKGIRVNAVAPGFIRTRMTEGIPDKVMDAIEQRIPLGYRGEPEDIANAFLWLASDEARYVSGHVLAVDGGAVI
ncbi:MAG: glucose 1-dehydrogenase [Caldilineaceae bacterium]